MIELILFKCAMANSAFFLKGSVFSIYSPGRHGGAVLSAVFLQQEGCRFDPGVSWSLSVWSLRVPLVSAWVSGNLEISLGPSDPL